MHNKFNPPQHNADGPNNLDHALTEFVLVFTDNTLTFSKTANDHRRYLDAVQKLLCEKQLLIKACECTWAQPELPYLGHVVGRDSVNTNPAKFRAVVDLPQPLTVKEVQQFLGLTRFLTKCTSLC